MRHHPHRAEESQDSEARAYNRLKQRKKDKPYHERYYTFYILIIIFGWGANLLSGVTESSKIYAFYYDFLAVFTFAEEATWILVVLSVVLIEIMHRVAATSYFKDLVEFDTHKRTMTPKLVLMLVIAIMATTLSFTGGFDLVRLVRQAPEPVSAKILEVDDIASAYSPLVSDIKDDIADFRKTREWKGRLSDDSARKWEMMKENKQQLQLKQAEALVSLSSSNLEAQIRVDSLNRYRETVYETQVSNRGYGLGFLSILAVFILYGCLWYDEEYQERKALYLEKKFGPMLPDDILNGAQMVEVPINASEIPSSYSQMPEGKDTEAATPSSQTQTPIGYYTAAQKARMVRPAGNPQNGSVQTCTRLYRRVFHRYTVPHTYLKQGQPVTVHYTLQQVNSRIGQYEREVIDAKKRKLGSDVLTNRLQWLTYWKGKRSQLLQQGRME